MFTMSEASLGKLRTHTQIPTPMAHAPTRPSAKPSESTSIACHNFGRSVHSSLSQTRISRDIAFEQASARTAFLPPLWSPWRQARKHQTNPIQRWPPQCTRSTLICPGVDSGKVGSTKQEVMRFREVHVGRCEKVPIQYVVEYYLCGAMQCHTPQLGYVMRRNTLAGLFGSPRKHELGGGGWLQLTSRSALCRNSIRRAPRNQVRAVAGRPPESSSTRSSPGQALPLPMPRPCSRIELR